MATKKNYKIVPNVSLAGFEILKRGNMTDKQYIDAMYEANKEAFQRAYDTELQQKRNTDKRPGYSGTESNFLKRFPTVKSYVKTLVQSYKEGEKVGIKGAFEIAIRNRFGEARLRFVENFLQGLRTHGKYEEFMKLIGGRAQFDANRLKIEDVAGNYVLYNRDDGFSVVVDETNSPQEITLDVVESEGADYGEEEVYTY